MIPQNDLCINMGIIINIQKMYKIINEKEIAFKILEKKSYNYLSDLQDDLIPLYNKSIRCVK